MIRLVDSDRTFTRQEVSTVSEISKSVDAVFVVIAVFREVDSARGLVGLVAAHALAAFLEVEKTEAAAAALYPASMKSSLE